MSTLPHGLHPPFLDGIETEGVDYFGAMSAFACERYVALAARCIDEMKGQAASGWFVDQAQHLETLWDEWCWYQAKYDSDCGAMSEAFEVTLAAWVAGAVEDIPLKEAVLLTYAASEFHDERPSRDDELLCRVLRDLITDAAGQRDLSQFERP